MIKKHLSIAALEQVSRLVRRASESAKAFACGSIVFVRLYLRSQTPRDNPVRPARRSDDPRARRLLD